MHGEKSRRDCGDDLIGEVINAAIAVHRILGSGLLESVYEQALAFELMDRRIPFVRQVDVPVIYRGNDLGTGFRADLIVEEALLLELKAVDGFSNVHLAQIMTYLRFAGHQAWLVAEFQYQTDERWYQACFCMKNDIYMECKEKPKSVLCLVCLRVLRVLRGKKKLLTMPTFAYKARNTGGQLVEGVLEGANPGAIVDLLRGQGVTPVEIKAAPVKSAKTGSSLNITLFKQKVSHIDLLLFSRQMHTLLKSGVPIMRALSGLQDAAINPEMKRVIGEIRESLEAGRELSQALARHPRVFSVVLPVDGARRRSHRPAGRNIFPLVRAPRIRALHARAGEVSAALSEFCRDGHGRGHRHRQHFRHSGVSPRSLPALAPSCR